MSPPRDKSGQPPKGPATNPSNIPGPTRPEESTVQSTTENVDIDVAMNLGDRAEEGDRTTAGIDRLRLEVARLRGELDRVRAERDISRTETAAARSMMKDYKESVDEAKSRVKELQKDLDRYRDRHDEEREDWRLKALEYEDEIDSLRQDAFLRTQPRREQPPAPYESPEDRAEFYSMYETDRSVGPRSATGTPAHPVNPLPVIDPPTPSDSSSVVAPANRPPPEPPVAPATGNSYSGVTRGTPAFRPSYGGPANNSYRPETSSGLASSRWADDGAPKGSSMKRGSTEDLSSSRGRHTPRGGTGFSKTRGNTRVASARRAAKSATSDVLEWTGRHTVNTTDPAGADAWRILDGPSAIALFQGGNMTSLDLSLHARQRLLVRHARMVPRDQLSATQSQVLQLALRLEQLGNHPIVLSTQVPTGVRFGESGTYSSVDMSVHRFLVALRPESRGERGPIIDRVNRVIGEIFSRPDTYRRLVASIAPDVGDDIYADPLDQTVLTAASRMHADMFPDVDSVTHRFVAQWLWTVVRVPRSVARHVLEPYFRRNQRHSIAVREFTRMDSVHGMPDDIVEWIQRTGAQAGRLQTSFVVRSRTRYAIRDLDRMVWGNAERTQWRWLIPPPTVQSAVARTAAQTLQDDVSYLEVDLDVDWMTEAVRAQFLPRYLSVYTGWEQEDLLAHDAPSGEPDFDQADTMDST